MSLSLFYMLSHEPLVIPLSSCPGSLKKESGIYVLVVNSGEHTRLYVGQTKNIRERMKHYRYPNDKMVICRAISKYGIDSCTVVFETCPPSFLNERERYWIANLQSLTTQYGYNIHTGAIGDKGSVTQATRDKMSCHHADVGGSKNPFWGRRHDEKTLSILRGKKPYMTDLNVRLKGKPVVKVSADTGCIVAEFPSSRNAATIEGIKCTSMSGRCNKKRPPRDGYYWRWKEDLGKENP